MYFFKYAQMPAHVKMRPPKLVKSGTVSSKNHRFESFTQRIAKLDIDPVRRVRRQDLVEKNAPAAASYFKASLEQWNDLNLSENFTDFARLVRPLCDSLPQLLHYQNRVMDLLAEYTGKMDAQSLEPLLSLLAHFAHDLGLRFEPHFHKAVTLVASVAAKHPDVEVIEWSFSCLAWLFKYLSRLLVPDLRPLYDILVPLLGKEHQKQYVVRFAAESMSFLLRKAGATYKKNKVPLENIVRHAIEDLNHHSQERNIQSYQQGLMTMFAGAIKGIKRGLHSSGGSVIRTLLETLVEYDRYDEKLAVEVVYGCLINLIHHVDRDGYKELMESVLEGVEPLLLSPHPESSAIGGRILFIMSGVRKGSRVEDWQPLLDTVTRFLVRMIALPSEQRDRAAVELLPATAVILQSSPMDVVIPQLRDIMTVISDDRLSNHFLGFCYQFAQIGTDRFISLMLPSFQRLVGQPYESQ